MKKILKINAQKLFIIGHADNGNSKVLGFILANGYKNSNFSKTTHSKFTSYNVESTIYMCIYIYNIP